MFNLEPLKRGADLVLLKKTIDESLDLSDTFVLRQMYQIFLNS